MFISTNLNFAYHTPGQQTHPDLFYQQLASVPVYDVLPSSPSGGNLSPLTTTNI